MTLIEGSIDAVSGDAILGWARDVDAPDRNVTVEVVEHGAVIASAIANGWRRDLQLAGKGLGFHAFRLRVPGKGVHEVHVRVAGTDHVIGAPLAVTVKADPPAPAFDRRAHTAGRFCSFPFEKFVLKRDGDVNLCCPSYLPVVAGNANHHTPDQIWNSPVAQEIRASILDGSFKYCLDLCPAIQKNALPLRTDEPRSVRMDEGPTFLSLLEDRTCNLSCPSCRTSLIIADTEEQERLRILLDRVIEPLLPGVHTLELAGGEFLASRHQREVLALVDEEKHPHLRIVAWTNGTLFNEKTWAQLKNLHRRFQTIHVSLDAARPATFERIRRGGDWPTLRQNLDFIAGLRRRNECEVFTLRFVVQRDNFREMGELVDLGRELGCDRVVFHELLNFGTFTAAEFADLDVLDPRHPLRDELAHVLADPRLDDPIADLGNLTAVREAYRTHTSLIEMPSFLLSGAP